MPRTRSFAAVAAFTLLSSHAAFADPPPRAPIAPPSAPATPRAVYRFEVAITGIESGPQAQPATYSIVLEENQPSAVSIGSNIPLQTRVPAVANGAAQNGSVSVPRQDVGFMMRLSFATRAANELSLTGTIEASWPEETPGSTIVAIHRMRFDTTAVIAPGTPAVVASGYDLATHRRYEVTVTARRVP